MFENQRGDQIASHIDQNHIFTWVEDFKSFFTDIQTINVVMLGGYCETYPQLGVSNAKAIIDELNQLADRFNISVIIKQQLLFENFKPHGARPAVMVSDYIITQASIHFRKHFGSDIPQEWLLKQFPPQWANEASTLPELEQTLQSYEKTSNRDDNNSHSATQNAVNLRQFIMSIARALASQCFLGWDTM